MLACHNIFPPCESLVPKLRFSGSIALAITAQILLLLNPVSSTAETISAFTFPNNTANANNSLSADIFVDNAHRATETNNFSTGSITFFTGSTVNDPKALPDASYALSPQNGSSNINNGKYVQFALSTINYADVTLSYATQRTSTGFNSQAISYSTNGTSFTGTVATITPSTNFAKATVDLSSFDAIENQSMVYIRMTFTGASGSSQNNRLDNVVFSGTDTTPELGSISLFAVAFGAVSLRRRRT